MPNLILMKKILFTLLLVAASISSFAQLKPEEGDIGISFRVTGLANVGIFNQQESILSDVILVDPLSIYNGSFVRDLMPQQLISGKYYYSPNMALRVGFGAGFLNEKLGIDEDGELTEDRLSSWSLGLNVGLEKHFPSAAMKIDPYGGFQINSAFLSKVTYERLAESATSNTLTTITYPAGYGVGGHLFLGFNYFFSSNFAIGAEASIGFNRVSMGGTYTNDVVNNLTGAAVSSQTGNIQRVRNFVDVNSTSGVILSVYF